ncbi:Ring finger domain/Zinc finger, C3HC4 type (RING finger) containing protein [Novymonas esmeraldas]|uniref:Ring finger domain/Zinc finger, C3HC4 type (RING finger) containing protein n=1 Tax=Novymonas esmeraldas TaxID=1808958 RepID=A0AAW0ESY5_9TRYP
MPLLGFHSLSGAVVEVVAPASTTPSFVEKGIISGGIVSAASAGDGVLYYLPLSSPSTLRRRHLDTGVDEVVQDLVRPHTQVFFHRNKVLCIPTCSSGVAVYDPLCSVTEILPIPYRMTAAEPADHGFVFRSVCNRVFGYDFSRGLTEVGDGAALTAFLGHYKRYAVALLCGDEERVVGVTEAGTIVELDATVPRVPFTSMDDVVLHADGPDVVSSKGVRVTSPIGKLQLSSSQPTDSEVVCTVCLCEFDGDDGVTLDCGHYFHKECIEQWVSSWMDFAAKGEHITFTHAVCPAGCKYLVRHPLLSESKRISELYAEVSTKKAAQLQSLEGTKTDEDLLYYLCSRCGAAFYGGERVCSRMQGRAPSSSPQDLVCDSCLACAEDKCSAPAVVFKCRYCCNPATHRSFGTRYMCERCNARWDTSEPACIPCPGACCCPFDGDHPESPSNLSSWLTRLGPTAVDHLFDRVAGPSSSASGGAD